MTEPQSAARAATPAATEPVESRWLIGIGLAITLVVALFGWMARGQMIAWGLVFPGPVNVFFRLYAFHEPLPLLLLVAWTIGAAVVMARRAPGPDGHAWLERLRAPSARAVGVVAALLFIVALVTWYRVHHAVLLTMDEFTTDFQARIIARGELRATLPAEWQPYVDALAPVFTAYQGLDGGWLSQYLPGYALMRTPFVLTGLEMLLNPLLAALSVVLLAAIARRLWPDEGLRPWMALAFLVTSSEVLMTSGTAYSMPAHLALNLLWLWLYQRGDVRSWGFALAVGVLALGLHNPMPHALFVAPFLLRLVRERRWRRVAAAVAVYGAGGLMWIAWLRMANPFARSGGPGLFSMFAIPNAIAFWLQAVNLSLLFTWHAPLFGVLAIAGVARARRWAPVMTDVALGVALTLAFYLFFPLTQGHGWGYRYAYQVLGSLALLAAAGAPSLVAAVGARRAQGLLAASFATALLVQVPLRFLQGERFVRPYAAAYRYVVSRPADVVIVHGDSIWYGRDLVRNDPHLQGQPVVLQARFITPAGRAAIERAHTGRVVDVKDGELLRLGLTPWVRRRGD
jgi:hypothetical protein